MSNYIIREDNRLNIEIAKSSQKIAEQARTDNMLNLRLAKATARVAEETRQDSSAMKTLALVTLTFLPATAVAVSTITFICHTKRSCDLLRTPVYL
jgi:hypothetical protein